MRKISKAGSENRTAIESCTVLFLCHGCFSDHCDKTYGSLSEFQSTLPVRGATANLHKINAEILAECLIILRKTEKRGQKACIGWKTKAKSRKRQENKVRRIRKIHDSLRAAPCVYTIKIPSAS